MKLILSIVKGYKYRVQATVKAYSGSAVETRTVTSSEAKYWVKYYVWGFN